VSARIVLVERLVGIVDRVASQVKANGVILARDLREPLRGVDDVELAIDIDALELVDQDDSRIAVDRDVAGGNLDREVLLGAVARLLHKLLRYFAFGVEVGAIARNLLQSRLLLSREADSRRLHGRRLRRRAHEDTISFEPTGLTTDAMLFAELIAQPETESLEQAIGLYGGELLEGFEVRAPEFESWLTTERERFREMALEAMTRLLDHHLSVGAVERGIRIAARLLVADPLQERVHRTLMELYCRQGRHGAALRQYRTCADLLAKELGIEPDAQTKALRRDILREWNRREDEASSRDASVATLCRKIAPR